MTLKIEEEADHHLENQLNNEKEEDKEAMIEREKKMKKKKGIRTEKIQIMKENLQEERDDLLQEKSLKGTIQEPVIWKKLQSIKYQIHLIFPSKKFMKNVKKL